MTNKDTALIWFKAGNNLQNMDDDEQGEFFNKKFGILFSTNGDYVDDCMFTWDEKNGK